jgi:hypothetical protein
VTLTHGDAKVVASRTTPALLAASSSPHAGQAASESLACSSNAPALVSQAVITFNGNWAEVSVPRRPVASAGADEFRLIHFEDRGRFVGIRLFQVRLEGCGREPARAHSARREDGASCCGETVE